MENIIFHPSQQPCQRVNLISKAHFGNNEVIQIKGMEYVEMVHSNGIEYVEVRIRQTDKQRDR